MKKFRSIMLTLIIPLVLWLTGPAAALAATTPPLGATATYSVLASTYTNTSATTINGDVGFTTGPAVAPTGTHANYGPGAPYAVAGSDQGTLMSGLSAQACTFTFPAGAIDLSTDITHGTAGIYNPGVYCSSGAMAITGQMTLSGSGTYIFRTLGALTSAANAAVSLTAGATACDVFWTPTQAITLAANTAFIGTAIDDAGITVGANTTWIGMALAFGGTVTTDTNTMTVSSCTVAVVVPAPVVVPVVVVPVVPAPVVPVVVPVVPAPAIVPVSTPIVPVVTPTPILLVTTPTPDVVAPVVATPAPIVPTPISPRFPNTGFAPAGNTIPWSEAAFASLFTLLSLTFYCYAKHV